MVKISAVEAIKKPVATSQKIWKRGLGSGALIGVVTGTAEAVGLHPFLSNLVGAITAELAVKSNSQKEVAILVSAREAMKQLMSAE